MERNRTVKDYLDLLDEATGLLLVGGQAVNLWAERYQAEEPSILAFQPFTSRDADFYRRAARMRLPINWTEIPKPTKGRILEGTPAPKSLTRFTAGAHSDARFFWKKPSCLTGTFAFLLESLSIPHQLLIACVREKNNHCHP